MILNIIKKIVRKGMHLVMRSMPIILPILFVFSTNSTACGINGQPDMPSSLKRYRKF